MTRTFILILLLSISPGAEGFYKDLFMDSGSWLTHRTRLYAAESLGLTMEFNAKQDTGILRYIMVANPDDANGYLLYPDGSPRFRCIFTNGGNAGRHGLALGDTGRQRIRDFVRNGGSYTGVCAGAYLASVSNLDSGIEPSFYHIWPGRTKNAGLYNSWVGNFIPLNSALLRYDSFGGDFYIDSLYLNGGPFGNDSIGWPQGTEILLSYDTTGHICHNRPAGWAWKGADSTGRVVVLGTHPEGWYFGERLRLTKAVIAYALDGVALPRLKGFLANGVPRRMNQPTGGDPSYIKLGDRQYHHFAFDLPPGTRELSLELDGNDSFDLCLYLDPDAFAFRSTADYSDTSAGADKIIRLYAPVSGRWFGAVECATTVETYGDSCFLYTGRTDVLNGVAYTITARWSPGAIARADSGVQTALLIPSHFRRTLTLPLTEVTQEVCIFDASGRQVATLHPELAGRQSCLLWTPAPDIPAGLYFIRYRTSEAKTIYLK